MRRVLVALGLCCAAGFVGAAPAPVEEAPRLLIVSNRQGKPDIYLVNAEGRDAKKLTDGKSVSAYPAWSPDRKKIAFASDRDGTMNVYVMDADGRNVKQLTKGNEISRVPTWSPDGKKIAYCRR